MGVVQLVMTILLIKYDFLHNIRVLNRITFIRL